MAETIFIEDSEKMPWTSSKEFAKMAQTGKFETGPVNEEYFSKWKYKVLRQDPVTGGVTRLLLHEPGWEQPNFGYHLHVEEAFRLFGEGRMPDESYTGGVQYNIHKPWTYTYRPPGWVHDGSSLTESMVFLTNDGPPTHVIATREMVGKNALYPDDLAKAIGPRGYIRGLDTTLLPWIPVTMSEKNRYLTGYKNASKVSYKTLSRDIFTGEETLLIKYDPNYSERNVGRTTGSVEIFVVDGSMDMFNKHFRKYGYAYTPKGEEVGDLESKEGCVFLIKSSNGTWFHSK